jgi:formylglycine-generating enzyme required for sulfatase activity
MDRGKNWTWKITRGLNRVWSLVLGRSRRGCGLACAVVLGLGADGALADSPPVVSNITASQRTDGSKLVDIRYNLTDADGDACMISVQVSDDGGSSWAVPITALTGAVGAGIAPGTNKLIVWNSATDLPGAFGSQFKVSVCADDSQAPPGMVLIPAGEFLMGDTFNEAATNERPVHAVYIDAFYMDRYEVTKGLWDTVNTWATANGYDLAGIGSGKAADHPVHSVNWYDCVKWCNARSQQEGRTPKYYTDAGLTMVHKIGQVAPYVKWDANGYRLPTEAEWEKAARGGVAGHRFPWSDTDTIQHARANYYSSGNYSYDTSPTGGYHPTFDTGVTPHTSPVGYFASYGYGLHDMSGNVWEWCNDWYGGAYYQDYVNAGSPPNPHGPMTAQTSRVLRGGGWRYFAYFCRVADRINDAPDGRSLNFGFRLALDSE